MTRIRQIMNGITKQVLLAALMILLGVPAQAVKTLVIVSSDQHSQYDFVEDYIRSTSVIRQKFLERNPDGVVIYLINGDFGGKSQWTTFDKGQLGYEIVGTLSKEKQFILGWGNHDGFDFADQHGNEFFLQQNKALLNVISKNHGKPSYLIGSNFNLTQQGKTIFRPYQDVVTPQGETRRYVGVMYDEFYKKSSYNRTNGVQLIRDQIPVVDYLKDQMLAAARDGVNVVYIMAHEAENKLRPIIETLNDWKLSQPSLSNLRIPVVYAAHNHEVSQEKLGDTWLINSGSYYQYTAVVLNEDGDLESHQFMGHKDQLTLGKEAKLTPAEDKVLTMISTEKAKIKEELGLSINIFESQGYAETKKDFKKGRVRLGNLICDAMRDYGVNELNTTPPPYKISGVLSFLTSSVYRREFPIPAGHISYSDILSMLPEDTETMKIGDIDGKSLQLLFSNIRAERILSQKKSDAYSPQLPSNVRETQNFQLEIQDSKNVWSPLDPKKTYRVVFDHWLGKNGPEIQEANRIFKEKVKWIQPVKSYTVANALVEFGKLDQRSCESALNP